MLNTCLPVSALHRCAEQLTLGLRRELDLTPKPGLVDRWDSGSHADLDYALMDRSITLLDGYFREFARSLERGATAGQLRALGQATEARMLAQFRTNTHRGAVFLGGLLLAGVQRAGSLEAAAVSRGIAAFALELLSERLPTGTPGADVRQRYGVGGIVAEALDGLPSVFETGLPALQAAQAWGWSEERALYLALARLMQTVQDTTALRRCGPAGLVRLKQDGATLESLLLDGKDPLPFLIQANRDYRAQRLTMGGVADLLGVCGGL